MATNKTQKLAALISRTGLWDEGIGFLFLGVATISAWGFASSSGKEGLFSIGLLAGFMQVFIISYALVGVAFVVTGYYLHSVQGKQIKRALIISAALSILAIVNIIPLIPAIFSMRALRQLSGKKTILQSKKLPAGFDVRDYPALSIMVLLVLITAVSSVIGLSRSHTSGKSVIVMPAPQVATCEDNSVNGAKCTVGDTEWGFEATFPGKPQLSTRQLKGGNPTSSYDQNTTIANKFYTYIDTNHKYGNDNQTKSYTVVALDYHKSLDDVKDASFYQLPRLRFGANASFVECNTPGGKEAWELGTATMYQNLSAYAVSILDGKNYDGQSCSVESLSVLKGAKVYSIQYVANPAEPDNSAFNEFLQSFSLTK